MKKQQYDLKDGVYNLCRSLKEDKGNIGRQKEALDSIVKNLHVDPTFILDIFDKAFKGAKSVSVGNVYYLIIGAMQKAKLDTSFIK